MGRGRGRSNTIGLVLVWTCFTLPSVAQADWLLDFWLTRDQQAQRAFDAGDYDRAAMLFGDPMRAGLAWYRAGEFERAAQTFGRSDTAEAHFNRGNALVLQGAYQGAIEAYDRALARRADWPEALENRNLAELRKARLAPSGDDAGGTGGKLAADGYVFDSERGASSSSGEEQMLGEGGDGAWSDERLRELWLRRVQTRPADFLAARFARQLQLREEGDD
jgi:Ca-activated chloride channel family protein